MCQQALILRPHSLIPNGRTLYAPHNWSILSYSKKPLNAANSQKIKNWFNWKTMCVLLGLAAPCIQSIVCRWVSTWSPNGSAAKKNFVWNSVFGYAVVSIAFCTNKKTVRFVLSHNTKLEVKKKESKYVTWTSRFLNKRRITQSKLAFYAGKRSVKPPVDGSWNGKQLKFA